MLVLSRKQSESIYIGDNIVVTLLEIRGNSVRLGIDAPKEIPILRSELQCEIVKFERPSMLPQSGTV